ncbi:MAG TPA: LuxR C-terminal-related transcriptional regulator, partial [Dehalococcoidia bacterium]|nr:LuxR C-terminal-related transcriptional regulator [Dehalococcoidia bacterium]
AAEAGRLFGAGEAALEALGAQVWPSNRPDYERWQGRARSSLGAAAFTAARAGGRLLSLQQATTLVLKHRCDQSAPPQPTQQTAPRLTAREREVALLAARGLTNRQIAQALVIADKTAANHVQHVLEKVDLHSRTQLAARAAELGLG